MILSAFDFSDHGFGRSAVKTVVFVAELNALKQARFTPMVDAVPAAIEQRRDFVNAQPTLLAQPHSAALQPISPFEVIDDMETKRT